MRPVVLEYLEEVYQELRGERSGAVADYIPELATVDPDSFAICLATTDGHLYEVGDSRKRFAIQSISKPFSYALALADRGLAAVAAKVDVEPSGEPFNEISLDPITERPRNPMINAGAITCASLVAGATPIERFERIRAFYSRFAGRDLELDERMFTSEDRTGNRNRAIGYMLRSFGILDEDPADTLAVYFRQCSLEVDCRDLALMAATLADGGVNPVTGDRVLDPGLTERVLSVMTTCGMYNAAGDWVTEVGLPAKSGVGGGIIAVLPGQLGLAVFSPRLDVHGNSVRGVLACRRLSRDLELHFMHVSRAARSAVRASYDVADAPSRRRRSPREQALLQEHRGRARVFELHGDLLFAGAESVLRQIHAAAADLDLVLLDLRRVEDIAGVSARMFLRLRDQLRENGVEAVIVDPAGVVVPVDPDVDARVRLFPDLNAAVEYAENAVIAQYGEGLAADAVAVADHPLLAELTGDRLATVLGRLLPRHYDDGEVVALSGTAPIGLLLILAGTLDISVQFGSIRHHLATFSAGTTFGTVYAISHRPLDVDAHARGPVDTVQLPMAGLDELAGTAPALLLALQRRLLIGVLDPLEWATRAVLQRR